MWFYTKKCMFYCPGIFEVGQLQSEHPVSDHMSTITNPLFRLFTTFCFFTNEATSLVSRGCVRGRDGSPLGTSFVTIVFSTTIEPPTQKKRTLFSPKIGKKTTCKRSYLEGMAVFSNLFAPSGCFLCVFFCSRPKLFHIKIVSNSLLP